MLAVVVQSAAIHIALRVFPRGLVTGGFSSMPITLSSTNPFNGHCALPKTGRRSNVADQEPGCLTRLRGKAEVSLHFGGNSKLTEG
jgi:hypothetical protein